MDREVVWSVLATADLESIVDHIFHDSEFYAATVARELVAAARSLTRCCFSCGLIHFILAQEILPRS